MTRQQATLMLLFISLLGYAQKPGTVTIRGQLLNTIGVPVPYAHIALAGYAYGTSSNLNGEFELKLSQGFMRGHELKISSIGYITQNISTDKIGPDQSLVIRLLASSTELDNIIIDGKKWTRKDRNFARSLVRRALRRVRRNFVTTPHILNTFYRHYCTEDSGYVRLVEAAIDLYDANGYGPFHLIPEQRLAFKVNQLRRSFDFTQTTKLSHPPVSLNYLITNDLLSYTYNNQLRSNEENTNFYVNDTTELDGSIVYEIGFDGGVSTSDNEALSYHGSLFIDANSLAFHKLLVYEEHSKNGISDSTWQGTNRQIYYREYQGKFYPARIITDINAKHVAFDSLGVQSDGWDHTSHIELMVNNFEHNDFTPFKGREPSARSLREIDYDSTFWNDYTVLKATPTEKQIIADLSSNLSLSKQFETFNTLARGGLSITTNKEFVDLIDEHRGNPIYVIAWAKWGYPNFYELQPISYLKRMLRRGKMRLLFVALEDSESEWQYFRNVYGLNVDNALHQRLDLEMDNATIKKFFSDTMPFSVIFDKQGKVSDSNPLLLNDAKIKPVIKALIKSGN